MAKKKVNGFIRYKAYNFVDKDPVIDVIRTLKQNTEMSVYEIQAAGGPTAGTLRNWLNGHTRRPQFATVAAAAVAMGERSLPLTSEGRSSLKDKLRGN